MILIEKKSLSVFLPSHCVGFHPFSFCIFFILLAHIGNIIRQTRPEKKKQQKQKKRKRNVNRSLTSKADTDRIEAKRKIVSIVHNCEYFLFHSHQIFVLLFRCASQSVPFLFLSAKHLTHIIPKDDDEGEEEEEEKKAKSFICLNGIIISIIILFLPMYVFLSLLIEITLMSVFLSFSLVTWNNLFNLCVSFESFLLAFFSSSSSSPSLRLYYSCLVRVGANLTYACRDRYAHTYIYTQLKLHLVRVWLHSI